MDDSAQASDLQHPEAVYRPFGRDRPFHSTGIADFRDPLPPVHTGRVFHYTDAVGVHGMITSGCVYASHAITMNDPLEGRYGWQIIKDRYSVHPPEGADRFAGVFEDMFLSAGDWSWETSTFLISGTSLAADLNQYRLYGMYQIELDPGTWRLRLNEHVRQASPTPHAQWRPVLYGATHAWPFIDRMLVWVVRMMDSVQQEDFEDTGLIAGWAVQALALHIKPHAYAHEQELRLIFGVDSWKDWVDVRPRGGRLIPFVKGTAGREQDGFIRSVELGPTVIGQANVDAVRHVHEVRYPRSAFAPFPEGLPVTESSTQYRDR